VLAQSLESSALIADSGGPIRPPRSRPLYPLYSSLCLPLLYPRHTLINDISHYVVVRNRCEILRWRAGKRWAVDYSMLATARILLTASSAATLYDSARVG
jgi:hypothetical protein